MNKRWPAYIALSIAIFFFMPITLGYSISWTDDIKGAIKASKQQKAPVMIDFYTKWCHWCRELDRNTYSDSKINELSSYFICVKLNAEENTAAVNKYDVRGYPTVVFLNYDGSVNSRVVGYRPAESFKKSMEYALKNAGVVQKKIEPIKNGGFELNGIIFDKNKCPVAIINNNFVKKGEKIGTGKIVNITKDRVEILQDGKTISISLE